MENTTPFSATEGFPVSSSVIPIRGIRAAFCGRHDYADQQRSF